MGGEACPAAISLAQTGAQMCPSQARPAALEMIAVDVTLEYPDDGNDHTPAPPEPPEAVTPARGKCPGPRTGRGHLQLRSIVILTLTPRITTINSSRTRCVSIFELRG